MQKRVKKTIAVLGAAAHFAAAVLFFASDANAQKSVQMSQSILPVRVAYVNEKGDVSGFWSNVSVLDNVYAIKFYRKNSTEEIRPDSHLMFEFAEKYAAEKNGTLSGSFYHDKKQNKSVKIIVESGSIVQEVETIV